MELRYFDRIITTPVVVCPEIDGMLISWFAFVELGILQQDYPAPIPKPILKIDNFPEDNELVSSQILDMKNALLKEFTDVLIPWAP